MNVPPDDTRLPEWTHALDSDPDLSGRRLGDYQLIRRLGAGGMSHVYLAEQSSLRRNVALKVLKRRLAQDSSYVRRFHREAQAAAKLVHASIVQIYEVGQLEQMHYIAQEYVPGRNLKQVLERQGPLKARAALSIMRRVLAALKKAGDEGITHRDIKPENIMIAPNGDVKVADFGLARIDTDPHSANLTQVGVTMGTPLYMSPEQIEGKAVDRRSDLYSFGVTCYHMFAGRPPFEGDTPLSIAVQHLKDSPPRLETLRKDLPEGLCRVVHRLLEKDPAQRYQSAGEALRALRGVRIDGAAEEWHEEDGDTDDGDVRELAELSMSRMASTQRLEAVMTRQRRRKRNWTAPLSVLLLCGAFGGGAAAAWLNRRPPLLTPPPITPTPTGIREFETAKEQYQWAALQAITSPFDSPNAANRVEQGNSVTPEEALLSVERFFPDDTPESRFYVLNARQKLAEYYMDLGRFDDALAQFERLAEAGSPEREFRFCGLLGQLRIHVPGAGSQNSANRAQISQLLLEAKQSWDEAPPTRDMRMMMMQLPETVGRLVWNYMRVMDDQPPGPGEEGPPRFGGPRRGPPNPGLGRRGGPAGEAAPPPGPPANSPPAATTTDRPPKPAGPGDN